MPRRTTKGTPPCGGAPLHHKQNLVQPFAYALASGGQSGNLEITLTVGGWYGSISTCGS